MLISIKGLNGTSKRSRTLSEYTAERRSSKSTTASGSLNTTIFEPITLKYKISVSAIHQRQKTQDIATSDPKALVTHQIP